MHVVDKEDAQKEQIVEEKVQEDLIDFEFGDLCVGCSCGHVEVFVPGIEGIQLPVLPATNKHELVLACAKCGHRLRIFFQESPNKEELRKQKAELQAYKDRVEAEAAQYKEEHKEEDGSRIIE